VAQTNASQVSNRLGRLEAEVEGIRSSLDIIARKMDSVTKTQWSPIIASIAVVVTIIGGLVTLGSQGPIRELGRHELAIQNMSNTRFTKEDGIMVRDLIDKLDTSLQREMRDLDRISETRLDNLDHVLQREMRLLNAPLDVRIANLEKQIEWLKDIVIRHQGDGHTNRLDKVEQEQRNRAKRVFKVEE
jgi:hypothetical protein